MQQVKSVIIVGAGPAGLMAAEVIRAQGHHVAVYDAKPSACRKFLLAGVGGMNITHSEPYADFVTRYYNKAPWLEPSLQQFNADNLRAWIKELGIDTFVGSSGRVFPADMKAAPLLRNWLKRLKESGVVFNMRHRLVDCTERTLTFNHGDTDIEVTADAIVLALGGGSWPTLGSDGAWQALLAKQNIALAPLESANCGFYSRWSEHLQKNQAGSSLKNVAFTIKTLDGHIVTRKGECIVTQDGMEGSLIYAFSKYIRDHINHSGEAELSIDLLPDYSHAQLTKKLSSKQGKDSFSKYLKRTVAISGVKAALLYECFNKSQLEGAENLATSLKNLTVRFYQTKPIAEAISSAGGVRELSVDEFFMLKNLPGVFCAGEMLDWEAPTGGYLLTACFATGRKAGLGVCHYLKC